MGALALDVGFALEVASALETGMSELLDACSAEEAGGVELLDCCVDDEIAFSVLLEDSAAEESASRTSLLMASWLCGMSRYLLLDEKSSLLELSGAGSLSGMSEIIGSPDSAQAMREAVAAMPRVEAIVAFLTEESFMLPLTFFFSIFKRFSFSHDTTYKIL